MRRQLVRINEKTIDEKEEIRKEEEEAVTTHKRKEIRRA